MCSLSNYIFVALNTTNYLCLYSWVPRCQISRKVDDKQEYEPKKKNTKKSNKHKSDFYFLTLQAINSVSQLDMRLEKGETASLPIPINFSVVKASSLF